MPGIASLSKGVIPRIMAGEEVDCPVLQILGVKRIMGGDTERLRLLISDSQYFNSFAMLATQLNAMFGDDKLKENTIVRVDKYITSVVNKSDAGKRVLIILEMTILNPGDQVKQKIGEPVTYTEASQKASAPAAKPAAAPNRKEPQANYNNNNSMDQTINAGLTHPIASLSPYQNKWVIKARVTSKSALRTWSNAKGEGKLFSMDLMDDSGEIRCTAFKEQCDKFYELIEVDKVYFISKCQLKPANKQYSTLKNDYEMTFNNDTVVQPCEDEDDTGIPEIKYDLVPISQVANLEPKAAVDCVGVCKEVGELQVFTSKTTNKEFKKRDLTLVDASDAAVTLTIWGDDAVNFDGHVQPVILVKGARVNEFNGGKSLSLGNGSVMKINPDIPESHKLRGWFDNGGGENITNSVSARSGAGSYNTEWRTFHEARNLGTGDKPDYFQTKAVVHLIKSQNAYYKACPQAECNKKVIDENNGHYRCERCNAVFPNFKYRLLVNMSIGDWTSNRWVTCFSDLAEQLLGRSAQEIGDAMDNNPTEAEEIFSSINFHSYMFKLRSKVETYGDMTRNKLIVQSASPINYKEYNTYLINSLKELTGINKA